MTATPPTAAPPMNWASLLADALVGTDRRTSVDPADLLDRSAAQAAFRRAGTRPGAAAPESLPAPAAPETRLLVGAAAARRLQLLLEGGLDGVLRNAVLIEWLELVRDRGARIPPELLPTLLTHGRAHVRLRPLIAEVGAARARWLAEQNPEWTYLTHEVEATVGWLGGGGGHGVPVDPQAWETGSHAQRRGYLGALRRRDPAKARTLLADEWATLAASERSDLLLMLATGLEIEDEPLLEAALDDKRKEVRVVAADLLVALPGSAYQHRATVRARHHLAVAGAHIDVRLPEACDPAMRRDGIVAKPPAGTGERAWWLEEILARAPLSAWPMPPSTLLSRLRDNEWASTIHRGLARAAAVHRDAAWAAALLDTLGGAARDREIAAALYSLLPAEEIVSRATRVLAARSGDARGAERVSSAVARLGPLLENCPRPWPPELSRLVLSGFSELARRSKVRGELYQLARLAALRLPVTAAAAARELAESLREVAGVDAVPLKTLAQILSFRHDMTQEIA